MPKAFLARKKNRKDHNSSDDEAEEEEDGNTSGVPPSASEGAAEDELRPPGKSNKPPVMVVWQQDGSTMRKLYVCLFCDKQFTTGYQLRRHLASHSGKRRHVCLVCQAAFVLSSSLSHHMHSHTGNKAHVCDECGQRFARSNALHAHKKTHSVSKDFVCPICGKSFHQKGNLVTHVNAHKGIKPFECPKCGKGFSQKSNLKSHMLRTHQEAKAFQCTLCSRAFEKRKELRDHEREEHHSVIRESKTKSSVHRARTKSDEVSFPIQPTSLGDDVGTTNWSQLLPIVQESVLDKRAEQNEGIDQDLMSIGIVPSNLIDSIHVPKDYSTKTISNDVHESNTSSKPHSTIEQTKQPYACALESMETSFVTPCASEQNVTTSELPVCYEKHSSGFEHALDVKATSVKPMQLRKNLRDNQFDRPRDILSLKSLIQPDVRNNELHATLTQPNSSQNACDIAQKICNFKSNTDIGKLSEGDVLQDPQSISSFVLETGVEHGRNINILEQSHANNVLSCNSGIPVVTEVSSNKNKQVPSEDINVLTAPKGASEKELNSSNVIEFREVEILDEFVINGNQKIDDPKYSIYSENVVQQESLKVKGSGALDTAKLTSTSNLEKNDANSAISTDGYSAIANVPQFLPDQTVIQPSGVQQSAILQVQYANLNALPPNVIPLYANENEPINLRTNVEQNKMQISNNRETVTVTSKTLDSTSEMVKQRKKTKTLKDSLLKRTPSSLLQTISEAISKPKERLVSLHPSKSDPQQSKKSTPVLDQIGGYYERFHRRTNLRSLKGSGKFSMTMYTPESRDPYEFVTASKPKLTMNASEINNPLKSSKSSRPKIQQPKSNPGHSGKDLSMFQTFKSFVKPKYMRQTNVHQFINGVLNPASSSKEHSVNEFPRRTVHTILQDGPRPQKKPSKSKSKPMRPAKTIDGDDLSSGVNSMLQNLNKASGTFNKFLVTPQL